MPADIFAETGHHWGTPLYRWDMTRADDFNWWVTRAGRQLQWMDTLRLDHSRGLEDFWEIPGHREDGIEGVWREAPDQDLLQKLTDKQDSWPMMTEDLGIITDEVTAPHTAFGLPGMKIMPLACGAGSDNPNTPENHKKNSVVYTDTDDNDTTLVRFNSTDEGAQAHALAILDGQAENMPWSLIEAALS